MGTANGWRRLCCEGHTVADATLTVAMAQIGQIMLGQPVQTFINCRAAVPVLLCWERV